MKAQKYIRKNKYQHSTQTGMLLWAVSPTAWWAKTIYHCLINTVACNMTTIMRNRLQCCQSANSALFIYLLYLLIFFPHSWRNKVKNHYISRK